MNNSEEYLSYYGTNCSIRIKKGLERFHFVMELEDKLKINKSRKNFLDFVCSFESAHPDCIIEKNNYESFYNLQQYITKDNIDFLGECVIDKEWITFVKNIWEDLIEFKVWIKENELFWHFFVNWRRVWGMSTSNYKEKCIQKNDCYELIQYHKRCFEAYV